MGTATAGSAGRPRGAPRHPRHTGRLRVEGGQRLPGLVGPRRGGAHGCPVLDVGRPVHPARRGRRRTERANEVYVEARRTWSAQQVVEGYRTVSSDAIGQLAELQAQDFELSLGDPGTYPAWLLPNAFAFDHYTHIRADLFAPRGPLSATPPNSDELRLAPAIDWIAAALPQQNPLVREALDEAGAASLHVVGKAGQVIEVGSGPTVATVTSDGPVLIRWVTQRGPWEQLGVTASGDERALAALRRLHVY